MKSLKQLAFLILSLLFIISCDDDDPTTLSSDPTENAANKQPLGTSANELLSSDEFTSLRVEIAYPEGFRPTDSTIELLIPFLEERLNKPDGITLVESTITTNTEGPYDINDIVAIEDANRSVFNNGDEMGVWLFFSDESSEGDSDNSVVLGTAYRNTSMVIYEKTFLELANNSTTAISRTLIETSTIRHEFGHIFGLVNGGTPLTSDHHDEENGRHCSVEDCLMYFQTVTTIFNTSNTASLPDFDALCIQDLQANGGL
ncbi:membrane metalloprotease [Dokdonia sp. Dokd-P16]|uniref:membrane metalloprotease n=1 Tax=Dokdonia sp. Dokd-P16 TaxID=2173169 RepID=UPI000D5431C9|nr:membrane metalloprotease [Dokdonia sp. Dokd-P16]AWH74894.1 membrane metalloprotease [Dokdonia sp. Dokd-P16]